ncbi:MAG: hypothetical protein IIW73_00045 [Clostridia bacterium]|nr:hypothetical protein [Clostridia bacterium]
MKKEKRRFVAKKGKGQRKNDFLWRNEGVRLGEWDVRLGKMGVRGLFGEIAD